MSGVIFLYLKWLDIKALALNSQLVKIQAIRTRGKIGSGNHVQRWNLFSVDVWVEKSQWDFSNGHQDGAL